MSRHPTHRALLFALLIGAFVVLACAQPAEPPLPSGAIGWEYQAVDIASSLLGGDTAGATAVLNPQGQQGWQSAAPATPKYLLKRRLSGATPWEYQVVDGASTLGGGQAGSALLTPLGQQGWEMVGFSAQYIVLQRPQGSGQQWEYQAVDGTGAQADAAPLNELGRQGWEVAGAGVGVIVLKRPQGGEQRWEYQVVDGAGALGSGNPLATVDLLNPYGREGWDVAAIDGSHIILRRALDGPATWEYQAVDGTALLIGGSLPGVGPDLNQYGRRGWDMAGVAVTQIILKRQISVVAGQPPLPPGSGTQPGQQPEGETQPGGGAQPAPQPAPPQPPVPQPVPVPDPSPLMKRPIVFVPGYWACSNGRLDSMNIAWKLPNTLTLPMFRPKYRELYDSGLWPTAVDDIYKDLLGHLIDQGYTVNRDLFVACYNWFGTLDAASDNLSHAVDTAYSFQQTPITIMTHSTGALVTRYAIVKNKIKKSIKDIIMIAPPNQGVAKSYYVWEGGFLYTEDDGVGVMTRTAAFLYCGSVAKAVLFGDSRILIQTGVYECLRQNDYISPIPYLDSVLESEDEKIPIVAWFIPSWKFITKTGSSSYPNPPIDRLNTIDNVTRIFDFIEGDVFILSGRIHSSTIEQIHVSERPNDESPLWYHGKPLCLNLITVCNKDEKYVVLGPGDGTILLSAASIPHASDTVVSNGKYHDGGDLTFEGKMDADGDSCTAGHSKGMVKDQRILAKISTLLAIDPPSSTSCGAEVRYLAMGVLSPVNLLITDASGRRTGVDMSGNLVNEIPDAAYGYTDDPLGPKIVFLPEPQAGEYRFDVTGIAEGEYSLFALASDSDQPLLVETGRIAPGETRTYHGTYTPAADAAQTQVPATTPVSPWVWAAIAAIVALFGVLIATILIRQRTPASAAARPAGPAMPHAAAQPPQAAARPVAALIVERGQASRRELPLAAGREYVLGRHPACDLALGDPRASARHAAVRFDEDGFVVVDLGSTNGTLLNGRPVGRARLQDGDRLAIGDSVLLFHVLG